VDLQIMQIYKSRICFELLSCRARRLFSRAEVKTCAAKSLKSANIKALYFSSVTKRLSVNGQIFNCAFNSLCFGFNFALRGFTNHAFVLNCCHVVLCLP